MCMEDVRLGRKSMSSVHRAVVASGAASEVLPGADDRIAIVFSPAIANHITYSLDNNVILGAGINLGPGDGVVVLDIQHHGDMVKRPWFGIADAGSNQIGTHYTILKEK